MLLHIIENAIFILTPGALCACRKRRGALRTIKSGGTQVNERKKRVLALLVGTSFAASAAGMAAAQAAEATQSSPSGSTADGKVAQLQEIIVTAGMAPEPVQKVPKVVEVISPAQLNAAGVTQIQDLHLVSVSVQGDPVNQFSAPTIRGITTFGFSIGAQSQTGVVLDDVPQPSYSTLANELADVTRIEILPGPQATVSGRNASAGLIDIVTATPSITWHGNLTLEPTTDGQRRISGYVTGPVAGGAAFSLSGYWDQWSGVVRNLGEGGLRELGFKQRGIRGKVLVPLTDRLSATLTAFYSRNDVILPTALGGTPYIAADPNASIFFAPFTTYSTLFPDVHIRPYNVDVQSPGHSTAINENEGATLRLDYQSPVGKISSITNYQRGRQPESDLAFPFNSLFGFPIPPYYLNSDVKVGYFYQELRVVSPASSDRLQYLWGLTYSDTINREPQSSTVPIDIYNYDERTGVRVIAGYGHTSYRILPKTSVVAGFRVEHDYDDYSWFFSNPPVPTSHGTTGSTFASWEASVRQKLAPNINGYVTYADNETGPVYDMGNLQGAETGTLQPIPSQKVKSIEVGVKSQWLDQRLTANLSAFRARYTNFLVSATQVVNQLPISRDYPAGKAKDEGVELQTSFVATQNLQLSLDALYLDTNIAWTNAPCYTHQTPAAGCVNNLQAAISESFPQTSKYRFISSANYQVPLSFAPVALTFGANYRYQTESSFSDTGDPLARQGGFGILDLSAGITGQNGRFGHYSVQVVVNNVADKHYYANMFRDPVSTGFAMEATYPRDFERYAGLLLTDSF